MTGFVRRVLIAFRFEGVVRGDPLVSNWGASTMTQNTPNDLVRRFGSVRRFPGF